MIPALLIGSIIITALAVCFWDEIKTFLKKYQDKIKELISSAVVEGTSVYLATKDFGKTFILTTEFIIKKVIKGTFGNKKQGEILYAETVLEHTDSSMPQHLKDKAKRADGKNVDISNELALELKK